MKTNSNKPSGRLVIARITYFIVPIKATEDTRKFFLRGYGWGKTFPDGVHHDPTWCHSCALCKHLILHCPHHKVVCSESSLIKMEYLLVPGG